MTKPTREEVEQYLDSKPLIAPSSVFLGKVAQAYLALLDENKHLRHDVNQALKVKIAGSEAQAAVVKADRRLDKAIAHCVCQQRRFLNPHKRCETERQAAEKGRRDALARLAGGDNDLDNA